MLSGANFTFVVFVIFVAAMITIYISDRMNKDSDPIDRLFNKFKIMLIGFAIMLVILLSNLPPLSVSNQPQSSQEAVTVNDLSRIIQQQNEMLLKLRKVVQWFVILFGVFFLPIIYSFIKLGHRVKDPDAWEDYIRRDWERKRAKGKRYYVLTRGALWAVRVGLLLGTFRWLNGGKILVVGFETLGQEIFTLEDKVIDVLFGLFYYGILYMGGYWAALSRWDNEENQYKNSIKKQSPSRRVSEGLCK